MAHIFTPALRRPLSKPFAKSGTRTLIQRAIASLRARGSNAHLWLPGVGTLNGLTTGNYLESTGNTLATVDNPVGLVLDALGTVGGDLFTSPTKVDFKASVVDIGGGVYKATWTGDIDPYIEFSQNVGNLRGKSFIIEFDIWTDSGQQIGFNIFGIDSSYADIRQSPDGNCTTSRATYRHIVATFSQSVAVDASLIARVDGPEIATAGNYFYFTKPVVREVTGIHAQQGTTANKPLLRRGLTNLLTYSSDFSNAAWLVSNGASKDSATTASVTTATNSTLVHYVSGLTTGTVYTACVQISGPAGTQIKLLLEENGGSYNGTDALITLTSTPTIYAVSFTVGAITQLGLLVRSVGTACQFTVSSAALFQGTLTASQILAAGGIPVTTTAAASNPDAGRYSWAFDGSNDSLALGSVPFQMGDDHCVVVGARCDSNAGYPFFAALANNSVTGAGAADLYVDAGINPPASTYGFIAARWKDDSGTTVFQSAPTAGYANGKPFVAAARKVGTVVQSFCNGQASPGGVAPVGAMTPTRSVIGTGDSAFPGTIGPVLAIKGTVTDAELLMYERLVAALTPNGPVF